jgi:hypothetical protein
VLTNQWVNENIPLFFQKIIKNLRNNKKGFVYIPEGNNEKHSVKDISYLPDAPFSHYFNSNLSISWRRCLLDSAASGLHYLGFTSLAKTIYSITNEERETTLDLNLFRITVETRSNKEERRRFIIKKIRNKQFDILKDSRNYLLSIVGVRSSDGKTDHAICVVSDWIFDSNYEKALPLNEESLNTCCSSDDRNSTFVEITRGYVLEARNNLNTK